MSRRDFFRKSLLTSLLVFGAQFGGATIAFLWPNLKGGFGSVINAGPLADIKAQIGETAARSTTAPAASTSSPRTARPTGDADYPAEGVVTTDGIMPLYQRCVHLGMPRAVLRVVASGSSAPATARSTTRPASTSWDPRRAAWTASR